MSIIPHTPTNESREKVKSYAAVGITQADISTVLGVDEKTLRKYYREELDTAAVKANATIGGALFNKAKGGDTSAMIWWTKTRMKWSEKTEIEHTINQLEVAGDLMFKKKDGVK